MTPDDGFPAVVWFTQTEALAYLQQIDPASDLERHTAELLECRTRLRQVGFRTLSYIAYEMIGRRMLRAYSLRDLSNVSFARAYLKERLYETDPRFSGMRQNGLPAIWQADQLDVKESDMSDPRARLLSASLRAHGMNCGLIMNLSAFRSDLRVAVSMTSEASDTEWIDDRAIGGALAVALTVHRLMQPYVDACVRRAREITLTDEQAAVLERLVTGLSDQEIADATSTSLHRVSYHVKMLQKVFNVENRAQLVYMAARLAWKH